MVVGGQEDADCVFLYFNPKHEIRTGLSRENIPALEIVGGGGTESLDADIVISVKVNATVTRVSVIKAQPAWANFFIRSQGFPFYHEG